jgi:hypothetical protein
MKYSNVPLRRSLVKTANPPIEPTEAKMGRRSGKAAANEDPETTPRTTPRNAESPLP